MFKIEVNTSKKQVLITVGGFFKEEEGGNFLKDYNTKMKSITPSTYTLALNSEELLASRPDMLPIMKQCMTLYKETGFKEIISNLPTSKISEIQLKKAIDEVGVKINFVKNI